MLFTWSLSYVSNHHCHCHGNSIIICQLCKVYFIYLLMTIVFLVYLLVLSMQIKKNQTTKTANQAKPKPSDATSVKVCVFSVPSILKSLDIFDGV